MTGNIVQSLNLKSPAFLEELNQTVGEYVLKVVEKDNNRVCLIDAEKNTEITTYEITNRGLNLATELQSLGCDANTIVGIISHNCLEYVSVILAINFTGAIATCFNHLYTKVELEHTLGVSRPSIVFCSSNQYQKLNETNETVKCIRQIILLDDECEYSDSTLLYSNLVHSSNKTLNKIEKDPNDTTIILYSSGTTGYPKGVMLSNRNLIYFLKQIRDENIWGFYGRYTVGVLPMCHIYGLANTLQTLLIDETLVFLKKFEGTLFLSKIQEYKVKYLFLVPPLVKFLLKSPLVRDFDVSSIEEIICGAAPTDQQTEEEIKRKLQLKYFRQGYGMTEAILVTLQKRGTTKMGSCGSLLTGIQARVIDTVTGKTVGIREKGEIRIKGPSIMKGYYRLPKETADAFDSDGWLHTGDVGYYDEDGDFFIIDRLKEFIKYKGHQVAPAELEALLMKHPDIRDAAVVGKKDEMAGEIPIAFVVKKTGSTVTQTDIIKYIAGSVSPQKRIRGILFVDAIPKNPAGKILRRKLKEMILSSKY